MPGARVQCMPMLTSASTIINGIQASKPHDERLLEYNKLSLEHVGRMNTFSLSLFSPRVGAESILMTMTATPAYQFFVSSGIPRPADERMRSHAIKAALRMRKQGFGDAEGGLAGRSSASSNLTLRSHAQLKGRFRAVPSPTSKAAPAQSLNSSKKGLVEVDLQTRWQDSTNITQSLDGYQQVSTTRRRESIPNSIQKAKLDPFDSLPVENNWRVNLLLKHCMMLPTLNLLDHALKYFCFP